MHQPAAHSSPEAAPAPARRRPRPLALAFGAMLVLAVAWAFAWGAHEHGPPVLAADLSSVPVDRSLTVDASTGAFDLRALQVRPGEVVAIHLAGSASAPHAFLLTGAETGAEMDQRLDAAGDTVIVLRVPQTGQVGFFCAIPGHKGMHGTLVVNPAS